MCNLDRRIQLQLAFFRILPDGSQEDPGSEELSSLCSFSKRKKVQLGFSLQCLSFFRWMLWIKFRSSCSHGQPFIDGSLGANSTSWKISITATDPAFGSLENSVFSEQSTAYHGRPALGSTGRWHSSLREISSSVKQFSVRRRNNTKQNNTEERHTKQCGACLFPLRELF